ncbi:MAG TPA: septal ring lytic transglycosylase RlpA family protein [Rubrobacter sp.]|nr:septal ring lytic transglycosylase RlpA family protein [Rubrobacter sp.]
MALSISKITVLAILAGGNMFAGAVPGPDSSGDDAVNDVASVHHADLGSIPHEKTHEINSAHKEKDPAWTMLASYYGRELEGQPMANGQPFDADAYTAAHKSLPFGTKLEVSYGGESVRVTVTDRGPYVAGRDLDLSLAAAQRIGLTGAGEAPVRVKVL